MNLEQIAAVIRPRTYLEAGDLGFRMVRAWWKPIFGSWLTVNLALFLLLMFSLYRRPWLAILILWWVKPLLDRMPVFVLGRALFGAVPTVRETVRAWPPLLRRDLFRALFWFRLDPMRAFRLPAWQLEGQRGRERRRRLSVLARGVRPEAAMLTATCAAFELALFNGMLLFLLWLLPDPGLEDWLNSPAGFGLALPIQWGLVLLYVLTVTAIEPFYIAGGFGLYINRRTHLEAWDIEVVFRRMAMRLGAAAGRIAGAVSVALVLSQVVAAEPEIPNPQQVIEEVLSSPEFGTEITETTWQLRESQSERPMFDFGSGRFGTLLASVLRAGMWVVALSGVIWVFVRLLANRRAAPHAKSGEETELPVELLGMDVREESLPDDVAGDALGLWESGQRKEALRLLYRGALSRLLSADRLKIAPSATEGDCLRLAGLHVGPDRLRYFRSLTETWQRSAYGHRDPSNTGGLELIRGWSIHFGSAV